MSLKRTPK